MTGADLLKFLVALSEEDLAKSIHVCVDEGYDLVIDSASIVGDTLWLAGESIDDEEDDDWPDGEETCTHPGCNGEAVIECRTCGGDICDTCHHKLGVCCPDADDE